MTLEAHSALADSVDLLAPIGLGELMVQAELQTRVDRKYLVPPDVISKVVDTLSGSLKALDMDSNRRFRYQSVYFDTEDYRSFRQHLQGRRHRFKVRTRSYLDSGECQLEVKIEGGREETVKSRLSYNPADAFLLTPVGRRFIAEHIELPQSALHLRPVLVSVYKRSTLVDLHTQSRITCDVGLMWESEVRSTPNTLRDVLVETKTLGPLSAADVLLRTYGYRPTSISKYCIGVALLNPGVRANPWHRTMRRHFDWTGPDGTTDLQGS